MAEEFVRPKRRPINPQVAQSVEVPQEPTVTPEEVANNETKVESVANNEQTTDWEKQIEEQYKQLKQEKKEEQVKEDQPISNTKEEKKDESPIVEKEKPEIKEETKPVDEPEKKPQVKRKPGTSLILYALGTDEDFENSITREFDDDQRPESAKTSDPTDYASGMAACSQIGQKNHQQRLLQTWLADKISKNTDAIKEVTKELRLAKITPKIGDGSGPKKLSGVAAKTAVISHMKGMYRVQLYNSGFWLTLRKPSLIEMDSWMQSIDTDFKEMGRILGGHAHAIVDCFVKQKLMEILPNMIITSNFESWSDTSQLIANISFQDYDTILWALCCMLYSDGVGIGIYCTNPDCRYVDDTQFIDLKDICYIDTTVFNSNAVAWMLNGSKPGSPVLSAQDLLNYRNNILGFKKTVIANTTNYEYELAVPTMDKYIDNSVKLISSIVKLLNGKNDIQNEQAGNQLTYHLYKMLTPWIKTLIMKDDNGNVMYRIEDREAIYESLSIEDYDKSNLYADIIQFIRDTRIAYFASNTLQCPKCKKAADLTANNLVPFDTQYLFFCLSCLQLEQTGASF